MWERFSYYGVRPLLILYMAAALADGGFGFARLQASAIVGIYAASVYLASLPGGWIADRLLGLRRAILTGAALISSGHISHAMRIGSLGGDRPRGRARRPPRQRRSRGVVRLTAVDKARARSTSSKKNGATACGPPDCLRQRVGLRRARRDPRRDADSAIPTIQEHAERLPGKIVVSMANNLVKHGNEFNAVLPPHGSVAAEIQSLLGGRVSPPRSTSCPWPSSVRSTTRWRATSSCSATKTRPRPPSWRSSRSIPDRGRSTVDRCATQSAWRRSRRCS